MSVNHSSEYNILGCNIRISADEDNNDKAFKAIQTLKEEIMEMREQRPGLRDIDLAVMSALKIASRLHEVESDYQTNVSSLRSSVEEALNYIEKVSPGSVNVQQAH